MFKILLKFLPLILHEGFDLLIETLVKRAEKKQLEKDKKK